MHSNTLPAMRHSYAVRIFYFLIITFVGLMDATVAMALILKDGYTTLTLRLGTVAQDVLLFIFPAAAASVMLSDNGGRLLCADRMPSLFVTLAAVATLGYAMPLMNMIAVSYIHWPLPTILRVLL